MRVTIDRTNEQFYLIPENNIDRKLLDTLVRNEWVHGFGRDVRTWDVTHAQIDIKPVRTKKDEPEE